MSLSNDEKSLLQDAICSGAFSDVIPNQNGQMTPRALSADVLRDVAARTDEEVRVVLRSFQVNAALGLTNRIAAIVQQTGELRGKLTAIQSVQIAPPPAPPAES